MLTVGVLEHQYRQMVTAAGLALASELYSISPWPYSHRTISHAMQLILEVPLPVTRYRIKPRKDC